MDRETYKQSRKDLNISVPVWVEKLGITLDIHKNYSSGREVIPRTVACHIKTLKEAQLVTEALCRVIGNFSKP